MAGQIEKNKKGKPYDLPFFRPEQFSRFLQRLFCSFLSFSMKPFLMQ